MTLSDFGSKVLKYFIFNSEEHETILFVFDKETYQNFFSNDEDIAKFEKELRSHVYNKGLKFNNDETAIALAAHQSMLAYEKIRSYLKDDTDRAINEAISQFFGFKNNQIFDFYYHKNTDNDNYLLWKTVKDKFDTFSRIITLPTNGYKYQKYPNEQIKFYRIFKNDDFNNLFTKWVNSDIVNISQIYNDNYCGELLDKYFSDSNYQTVIPILWAYYSIWKRNIKVSESDNNLYIELYDDIKVFKIAGDVFNRKRNHINSNDKRFYKVFEHDSGHWWRGSNDTIPLDKEFVLLVDKQFEEKFSNTNPIKYEYIEEDCEYIVYKYKRRPENFNTDFPLVPQLIGGVRLYNNQYLDIPWLLPINKDGLKYNKITPFYNIDDSLIPIWDEIDGLKIISTGNQKYYNNIEETESKIFEERNNYENSFSNEKLTEQEIAVLECQQALFLWLATKGKADHLSIHNICLNIIANYDCLEYIENDYPEYFILQPLFKAGIIELYKNKEGKYYYALAKGGNFTNTEHFSYMNYINSYGTTNKNIECYLDKLPIIEDSFYVFNDLFDTCSIDDKNTTAFVRYSTNYSWAYGLYETTIEKIIKHPAIFKTSNIVYMPTYFNDSNGKIFKLKDDFANPWYPVSWNICESYIDIKRRKNLFVYIKKENKLICKDFTALPLFIARALICNDKEKLKTQNFWLSYFNQKYKIQEFNNVSENLYKILKNKFLSKRDVETVLIKTNAKNRTFSFKGSDYELPSKESYRIFRFKVQEEFRAWQSTIDTDEVPTHRPFAILIDSAYGEGYLSHKNATIYQLDKTYNNRPMSFVKYSRLPDDFASKLKYYNIKQSKDQNILIDIPNIQRGKLKSNLIDGLIPADYKNVNFDAIDNIEKKYSCYVKGYSNIVSTEELNKNIHFLFGEWVNELNIIPKILEIENVKILPESPALENNKYEIISFTVKDTKAVETKMPLSNNKDKWEKDLAQGKRPWEYLGYCKTKIKDAKLIGMKFVKPLNNITLQNLQIEEKDKITTNFISVFQLQEKLYEWLKNEIGYATLAEIHEFLMREIEIFDDYEFYGTNPESKILMPLVYCGIIDKRYSEKEETFCYTISKSKKLINFPKNNFEFDYQLHYEGGTSETLDSDDISIYLMSLFKEKIQLPKKASLKKLVLYYDEKQKILSCPNITLLPWQIVRALIMIDIKKISNKDIYLSGCKEYESVNFYNVKENYIYIIDTLITKIKNNQKE